MRSDRVGPIEPSARAGEVAEIMSHLGGGQQQCRIGWCLRHRLMCQRPGRTGFSKSAFRARQRTEGCRIVRMGLEHALKAGARFARRASVEQGGTERERRGDGAPIGLRPSVKQGGAGQQQVATRAVCVGQRHRHEHVGRAQRAAAPECVDRLGVSSGFEGALPVFETLQQRVSHAGS